MRIVLDAMGSDEAPGPEIEGAVAASLEDENLRILLVGDEEALKAELAKYPKHRNIDIVHASERVAMTDAPTLAIRKKKESSLLVGLRLVKEGEADGFISAGNTGAVMLGSRVVLGPMRGVARSAICQVLPTKKDPVVILDLGANVECTADHLCQFAEMGSVFSRIALGVENPKVGLLNIGEEQVKGGQIMKSVHRRLSGTDTINFIGNVEPKAIFDGKSDVVVCDGFVGNLLLKTSESVASLVKTLIERELRSTWLSMLGGALSLGAFKRLKKTTDPNEHSGAPLLGVNGYVIILHGSCTAQGVMNGILGARKEFQLGLNEHIRAGIESFRQSAPPPAEVEPAK